MRTCTSLIGKRFGKWTVLYRISNNETKKIFYMCRCECGAKKPVRADALKRGKSTGCKHCTKLVDLKNQQFGHWKVIEYAGTDKNRNAMWLCKCNLCDKTYKVASSNLLSNKSTCCRYCSNQQFKKHGESNSRIYRIWVKMRARCYNKQYKAYKDYGARGITVCDMWKNDSTAFIEWAKKSGYRDNLTLDRIDLNKGYYPENCRWASLQEQQQTHKRRLIEITYKNKTQCLAVWCRTLGLNYNLARSRIHKGYAFADIVANFARNPS